MRFSRVMSVVPAMTLGVVLAAQQPSTSGSPAPQGAGGATQAAPGGGRRGGRGTPVEIQPGQECPPGMTEVRPRSCQAPDSPPPSIVDYRPRSTLVVSEH